MPRGKPKNHDDDDFVIGVAIEELIKNNEKITISSIAKHAELDYYDVVINPLAQPYKRVHSPRAKIISNPEKYLTTDDVLNQYIIALKDVFSHNRPITLDDAKDILKLELDDFSSQLFRSAVNHCERDGSIVQHPNDASLYQMAYKPSPEVLKPHVEPARHKASQSILMDEDGNMVLVPDGKTAHQFAQQLLSEGKSKKLTHFTAVETFEATVIVVAKTL